MYIFYPKQGKTTELLGGETTEVSDHLDMLTVLSLQSACIQPEEGQYFPKVLCLSSYV